MDVPPPARRLVCDVWRMILEFRGGKCMCGRGTIPFGYGPFCYRCDPGDIHEGDDGMYMGPYDPSQHLGITDDPYADYDSDHY